MFAEAFPHVANSPSLIWVIAALCLHIVNTFVGLFMAFRKTTPPLLRMHLVLYGAILVSLALFLVLNGVHGENTVWDYGIGLYFITLLPYSGRWDVMVHGLVAVVGLTLLPVLILLQV